MLHKRLKFPSHARCFICSLNNLTMFIVLLYSPLAGGALPFAVDQKEVKVLSKSSFSPHHGFIFPAHFHEYPQKPLPAYHSFFANSPVMQ